MKTENFTYPFLLNRFFSEDVVFLESYFAV